MTLIFIEQMTVLILWDSICLLNSLRLYWTAQPLFLLNWTTFVFTEQPLSTSNSSRPYRTALAFMEPTTAYVFIEPLTTFIFIKQPTTLVFIEQATVLVFIEQPIGSSLSHREQPLSLSNSNSPHLYPTTDDPLLYWTDDSPRLYRTAFVCTEQPSSLFNCTAFFFCWTVQPSSLLNSPRIYQTALVFIEPITAFNSCLHQTGNIVYLYWTGNSPRLY